MIKELKSKNIIIKADSNAYIDKVLLKENPGILLVHADWCGHCKRFIPVYKELADTFSKNGDRFNVFSIESAELTDKNVVQRLNVVGFPTIYFFDQNGLIMNSYNGSRDKDSLLNQICKVYHHCISKH